jgi:hypothetical protein|tara:strand:+ start:589 stop:969 length:381 start_codon:yes stop_codon:yes gene_type:complete
MKTLLLVLLLFFVTNVNGGMLSHAQEPPVKEPTQPEVDWRMLPSFINCTDINTLNSVISKYDELPLLKGKGMILIPGQAGSFENELRMYVNPKTGSFSVVLMLDENAGCMVVIGKDFTPWIDKTPL